MRSATAVGRGAWTMAAVTALGVLACGPPQQPAPPAAVSGVMSALGWIDASAPLDPATTPVYDGNAPLKFSFLLDMRKGDVVTLSALALGAHSGTHVDAPMHFIADGAPIDQVSLDRK